MDNRALLHHVRRQKQRSYSICTFPAVIVVCPVSIPFINSFSCLVAHICYTVSTEMFTKYRGWYLYWCYGSCWSVYNKSRYDLCPIRRLSPSSCWKKTTSCNFFWPFRWRSPSFDYGTYRAWIFISLIIISIAHRQILPFCQIQIYSLKIIVCVNVKMSNWIVVFYVLCRRASSRNLLKTFFTLWLTKLWQ